MKRYFSMVPVLAVFLVFGCEGGNFSITIDGLDTDSKFAGDSKTNDLKEPADDTKEDRQQADDDGTVADDDGTVADDDGTIADDDGTVADDDGTVADDDGTVADDDGTVADDDGTVADDDGTVADDDGSEPQECEIDEDCEGEPLQCHKFTCEEGVCIEVPVVNETPCSDGDLCTVDDTCQDGVCESGPAKDCDDDNECTEDNCIPTTGVCEHPPIMTTETITCGQGECFREVPKCIEGEENVCVPGEPAPEEVCDGLDNDCDGETDNNIPGVGSDCRITSLKGVCADGVLACEEAELFCKQINYPSAEVCDGLDNDCDGETDPPNSEDCTKLYRDADGDGYGNPSDSICVCDPTLVDGYVLNGNDCCDQDANAYPGATDWFTTPNGCGSFDYDCSDVVERQFPDIGACTPLEEPPSTCALTEGWSSILVPRCGSKGVYIVSCRPYHNMCMPGTSNVIQGCH